MKLKRFSIYALLSIGITSGVFFSCSTDSNTQEQQAIQFNLKSLTKYRLKSSDTISTLFASLGVSKINVEEVNSDYLIHYETKKLNFGLTREKIDLTRYKFWYNPNDRKLTIDGVTDYALFETDKGYYINTPVGVIDPSNPEQQDMEIGQTPSLLMLIRTDLMANPSNSTTFNDYYEANSGGDEDQTPEYCKFMDQYTVVTLGFTRKGTELSHQHATSGDDPLQGDCRLYTDAETSCLGDNHACMTTSTYCCD